MKIILGESIGVFPFWHFRTFQHHVSGHSYYVNILFPILNTATVIRLIPYTMALFSLLCARERAYVCFETDLKPWDIFCLPLFLCSKLHYHSLSTDINDFSSIGGNIFCTLSIENICNYYFGERTTDWRIIFINIILSILNKIIVLNWRRTGKYNWSTMLVAMIKIVL